MELLDQRKGVDMVIGTIILIVILVIMAGLVMFVFRGTLLDFGDFLGGQQETASIQTCQSQITSYCRLHDADDDWSKTFSHCEQHMEVISSASPADTLCGSVD